MEEKQTKDSYHEIGELLAMGMPMHYQPNSKKEFVF